MHQSIKPIIHTNTTTMHTSMCTCAYMICICVYHVSSAHPYSAQPPRRVPRLHVHRVDTSTTSRGAMISIPTFTSTPQDTRHAALLLSAHAKHAHHPSIHTQTHTCTYSHQHHHQHTPSHHQLTTQCARAHMCVCVCVCVCALRFVTQDTLTYTMLC